MSETGAQPRDINWGKVIETALNMPGDMGSIYSRFYNYSFTNQALLYDQGIREPVATMKRWNALGRTVLSGSRAYEIVVPIFARKPQNEADEEAALIGFRSVKRIFTYSQTDGDELPRVEIPKWDYATALGRLAIQEVPFREINGNMQGVSQGRDIAINPVAVNPTKTRFHEIGHVVLGHTTPEFLADYAAHRGVFEFQAEAVAYLSMNELEQLDETTATRSRGYIQKWLRGERPADKAIRQVFAATDKLLQAGRLAVSEAVQE